MKTMLYKIVLLLMILLFATACTPTDTTKPTAKAITPTPLGGLTFTPTLVQDITQTPTPLGGLTFTPTLVQDITQTPTPLGGLTFTPTLVQDITQTPTPLGGLTFTPTQVGSKVITITPTKVVTLIPVGLKATALKNANCRYGPGTAYDIADTLFAGKSAPIVGRNEQNTWWQIQGPAFGSLCWVSKVTVEVSGPTDGVPIAIAPPPPTITPEPRPKPQGCYVYDAAGSRVCTVPCPANAKPGGACKP
jgi:uncharacterized protein YgiM (DUF1202 family)